MYFLAKTNDHCHQIQHIGISLGTTFYLKQAILIFLYQICRERVFSIKAGQMGIRYQMSKYQIPA